MAGEAAQAVVAAAGRLIADLLVRPTFAERWFADALIRRLIEH